MTLLVMILLVIMVKTPALAGFDGLADIPELVGNIRALVPTL